MITSERNLSIDLVKIVAMYCIICLHTTMKYTDSNLGFIIYTISGLGMPLFFMVSGYLMWNRDLDYKYVFSKTFRIIKFVAIMSFIFWIVFGIRNSTGYLEIFFGSFLQQHNLAQFWYFLSIIIIYLTLPLCSLLRKRFKHFTLFFICFWGCIALFWHVLNCLGVGEMQILQPFRIWNWFFLFSLGGV